MIAVYLSPLYIILCVYLLYRLLRWLGECYPFFRKKRMKGIILISYTGVMFSILIAFLMEPSHIQRGVKTFSNYWLGVLLYALLVVIIVDMIRFILKRTSFPMKEKLFSSRGHIIMGMFCVGGIALLSVTGILNAREIKMTDYKIKVEKRAGNLEKLKIVLVADLHLGYSIGNWHMEQMVEKINQQKADLIVIAGDIFDNEYEALENPEQLIRTLQKIQSKYGVYACYGNHDIEEKILAGFTFSSRGKKMSDPRMDEFLERAKIQLLQDEGILIDNAFYLYGRPDYERPGRGIEKRKRPDEITKDMDQTKPIIIIDHEPRELQELADAGVDLDLCGHTHDGQTFPSNITVSFLWENSYGYLKKDEMHHIVTSGVGVFGPNMRLGTKSEICAIEVEFEKSCSH